MHADLGRETSACIIAFDQIMREERVLRKASMRRALEGVHIIDALSGEASLSIEVLVHVRDGGRVGIDPGMPGMQRREARAVRARERDAHARLDDAVPRDDATTGRIVHRAIQWMRERTDQRRRRLRWQQRIGIECDDEAHLTDGRDVADDRRERFLRAAAQEAVELRELPALALPSHPHALLRIPAAGAMEQIERVLLLRCIPRIERAHPLLRRREDRGVGLGDFRARIGEVTEHREVQVRFAIGEVLRFEIAERFVHTVDAREERGDDDRRAEFRWHTLRWQVELGQ